MMEKVSLLVGITKLLTSPLWAQVFHKVPVEQENSDLKLFPGILLFLSKKNAMHEVMF